MTEREHIASAVAALDGKMAGHPTPAEHIMQFFAYAHLPAHLQVVSKPFGDMAQQITDTLPRNPERTVALRKLLEDQLAALTLVKTAHETGDYAALLAAVHDVEVKTEQKTRRVEVAPATTQKAREEDANRQS